MPSIDVVKFIPLACCSLLLELASELLNLKLAIVILALILENIV